MQHPKQLICGDCLEELQKIPDGACQLIYLDPPFNTNLPRTAPVRRRARADDATLTYTDSFGAPINYVAYMRPRVQQMRRVLAGSGSLFFHCDWRMGHHVRLMLDEIFARDEVIGAPAGVFVNEIIWHYGLGAARSRRKLLTKHDVIFWFANSVHYTFNVIRTAPTHAMVDKYRHVDENGNHYMNSYGKRYLLKGGKPLDDVWDIPAIAPTSAERSGYPTQKPLALLERIIQLASNERDTVLDPFCGSGTTLVAAKGLGRGWIGIDRLPQAIEIARQRLE